MTEMFRWIALAATLLLMGSCGLMSGARNCSKPQPYQTAEAVAPLTVPAGADLPDTRNALKIPEVKTPEKPQDAASCIDHPPPYGTVRPQPG